MYEELYEPIPDVNKYLARLGITEPAVSDLSFLNRLIKAHQCNIVFENMNSWRFKTPVVLGIKDLYKKMILEKRGGYCYELNALFTSLLNALGFEAYSIFCRIWRPDDYTPPISHRGVLVKLDGTLYFCDVGYGGPSPSGAVPVTDGGLFFESSGETEKPSGEVFKITRTDDYWWLISRSTDGPEGTFERSMSFTTQPQDPVDFLSLNWYSSTNPDSPFTFIPFLNRRTSDGNISVLADTFTIKENGVTTVKKIENDDELTEIALKYFELKI